MEKNSCGKLLIDLSRASKITHIGHKKNFKAKEDLSVESIMEFKAARNTKDGRIKDTVL